MEKLMYGKYKNKTFKEILDTDLVYCTWAVYHMSTDEKYREFCRYVRQRVITKINSVSVTSFIKGFTDYHIVLMNNLIGRHQLELTRVYEPSRYPNFILQNKLCSHNGMFVEYFVRKYIYMLKGETAYDSRAVVMLKNHTDDRFTRSYRIYREHQGDIFEILEHIFNTSLLHAEWFSGNTNIEFNEQMVNVDNLRNIMEYVRNLDGIRTTVINPSLGRFYIGADANLIIGDTIVDIKVSKNPHGHVIEDFYRLVLYSGLWTEAVNKVAIYNTLLGEVASVQIQIEKRDILHFIEDHSSTFEDCKNYMKHRFFAVLAYCTDSESDDSSDAD